MKEGICTGIGVVGSVIASLFGGWDAALITLMIFMGIDYLTGLIVAGVFIRDAVVIAFIANETISIIENAGLMGVPIPSVIVKAIEVLKKQAESEDKENE